MVLRPIFFPEMPKQLVITGLTELNIPPIKLIDYPDYYLNQPHLDSDWTSEITFPGILDYLFEVYYGLETGEQKIINTAISYTVSAIELSNYNKTLSLLASFTSLETMVNLEYQGMKAERCEQCGQQKFSISRKFREYLLKYLGDTEENKKKFNKYYNLRSKIVHTGQQLKGEILFAEVDKKVEHDELITRVEILQLGRLGIISWLINKIDPQTGASLSAAAARD
jgi:hypothetical protein